MASCLSLRHSRDTLDFKTERMSLLNVLLFTSITRTRCALPDESRTVRVVTSDEPLSLIFAIRNLAIQFTSDAKIMDMRRRSEEHTSELQSLMRISYAVFCLKKKKSKQQTQPINNNKSTHTNTHNDTSDQCP